MEKKNPIIKQDPPVVSSGYLSSLVRQLSSTRPQQNPHPNSPDSPSISDDHIPAPQKPKKQVRRRLNHPRPYQGKLLNLAEARREIVMALKFHRAAMKQAEEQLKHRQQTMPAVAAVSAHSSSLLSPITVSDNFMNFTNLHTRPLGLNLNFQGFTNVETPLFRTNKPAILHQPAVVAPANKTELTLHPAMGDEEMAEIISMSEMHDMEWNDTMNSVSMARWSELLMSMEADGGRGIREGDCCHGDYLLESQMEDDQLQPW